MGKPIKNGSKGIYTSPLIGIAMPKDRFKPLVV